jgi:hypothetical protein
MEDKGCLDDDTVWILPGIIDVLWYDLDEWGPIYGSMVEDNKD